MPSSEQGQEWREPQAAPATGTAQDEARCSACSNGVLLRRDVTTAFWQGESLLVIQGIPAFVCQSCGEQYYQDETAMKLDLMRGAGFPEDKAVRTMTVPVFDFVSSGTESPEETLDAQD